MPHILVPSINTVDKQQQEEEQEVIDKEENEEAVNRRETKALQKTDQQNWS
jgi:hypothetical protein